MKTLSKFLRPTLALLLAMSSIPAWACARTCSPAGDSSLACVRICARSQALLTDGGKLESVGAQACGVMTGDAQVSFNVAIFELAQPEGGLAALVAKAEMPMLQLALTVEAGRAPPIAPDFLRSYHPQANAPPSFC